MNLKKTKPAGRDKNLLTDPPQAAEKWLDGFIFALLAAFGIYQSILYFGHQQVPHFDFNCFAAIGRQILSLQVPTTFKRVPLVGILQVLLGYIAGGESPDLRGGWLLNSLLQPGCAVLFWLAGRRIIGRAAAWLAVIMTVNPWVVQLLTEAIVETTLLFCVLATFYLIFRRSNYSYLMAAVTTMVRYEGAALILAAFVVDMIKRKSKSQRIRAFLYSAAASVPLAIWILGTAINWKAEGSTYYLKEIGAASGGKFVLAEYISLVWRVGFYPLFMPPAMTGQKAADIVFGTSQILAAATFVFGCVYGLYRRQWNILALLIFFVPYICIHALHSFVFDRFCMPVSWIGLLICAYGLKSLWEIANKPKKAPALLMVFLQAGLLVAAVCWTAALVPYLGQLAQASRRSVSLPYAAGAVVMIILAAQSLQYGRKFLWKNIVTAAVAILMIVSNQFVVAAVVGNGERDVEFKYLLDWYLTNAKKGERLATTVPIILQTMAPKYADCFVHTANIEGNNPYEFVQGCYKQNITYVAWDSRMGLTPGNRYYTFWHMKNIEPLALPRDIGPYRFIVQLKVNERRYINVFRLLWPEEIKQGRRSG